jgi:hypothetical protein
VVHEVAHAPLATVRVPVASPAPYEIERDLGHRAFDDGQRLRALHHYEHALMLDARAADFQLIDNLIDCYGYRRLQPTAAALIVRFKLRQAEGSLARLGHSTARGTRWGAIHTREKLDHVPKRDYVEALALDLAGPDCTVYRRAVAALHALGGREARHLTERRALPWQRACLLGSPIATAKKTHTTL